MKGLFGEIDQFLNNVIYAGNYCALAREYEVNGQVLLPPNELSTSELSRIAIELQRKLRRSYYKHEIGVLKENPLEVV